MNLGVGYFFARRRFQKLYDARLVVLFAQDNLNERIDRTKQVFA